MKRLLQGFFVVVLVAMTWATVVASAERSVIPAAADIWADPWGRATLFDAYFAFLTVYLWMAWREPTWPRRLLWLPLVLTLGNFAIAAYFLLALAGIPADRPWTDLFEPLRRAPLSEEN